MHYCWTPLSLSAQEDIAKLLRFESSALPAGERTNLMEYSSRMKAGTRNIYYLCAPNRHLAEHSPYYEAMKQKDMEVRGRKITSVTLKPELSRTESVCLIFIYSYWSAADALVSVQVLFCYEQFDELTLLHLREFDGKKMISAETDIVVDHYKEEKFEDTKPGALRSRLSGAAGPSSRLSVFTVAFSLSPQPPSV